MRKIEVELCQDCMLHVVNGQVEWSWADSLEKEEIPPIVDGFYEILFARKGVRGDLVAGELESVMKEEICDLCLNYDQDGEQGRPLWDEFWQCVILVDKVVIQKPLYEALMSHYCSLREEQDIEAIKLKLYLDGMETISNAATRAAKESGRAVSININEFIEVLFYNSAGEAVEPLFHRLDFGTLEVDGESQEVIVRTSSKHDNNDWMTATFQIT